VLTFDSNPTWFNLESHDSLANKIAQIKSAPWGMSTDFYKAMEVLFCSESSSSSLSTLMFFSQIIDPYFLTQSPLYLLQHICTSCVEAGLTEEEIPKGLVVFSDMQFDSAAAHSEDSMAKIKNLWEQNGFAVAPKIIFWNLAANTKSFAAQANTTVRIATFMLHCAYFSFFYISFIGRAADQRL
jgi:hypothetical protein